MRSKILKTPIIAKLILVLIVAVPALAFQSKYRPRAERNHSPIIESFSSSVKVFALCPFASCSASGNIITLEVSASDPDHDNLTYKYSVGSGTIIGSGKRVSWDLTEARFGIQTAKVEVTDQRGGKISATATVDVVMCGSCDPPCPTLSVSCPSEVKQGEVADFVATVSGPDQLTYLWSHSNGKRIAGQEGSNLKITAVGSDGDVITATVTVLGLDPACNRQASCESRIVKRSQQF